MSMSGKLETKSNGQFSTVVEWNATRESSGKGIVIKASLFIKPQVSILIGGSLSSITIDGDRRQTNSGNQYHAGHTYLIQEMTKRVEYDSNGAKKIRLSSEAIAFDQRSSSPSPLAQRTDNEIELDPLLRPDFTDFNYRSTTEKISALLGTDKIIVEKKSALEITINPDQAMIAKEGSAPSFYYFNFCGKSFSAQYEKNKTVAIRDILVDDCGDNKITVSAVDNRGMSTSVIKSMTILKYAPPTLNIVAKRKSNFERATEIKVDSTFSRLIVEGADKNSIKPGSLRYRVRKTGEDWSSWVEKSFSINGEKCVIENTYLNLDNAFSWEIEFEIEDLAGEKTSQTAQVGSGVPLLMISDSTGGVGIGKMPAEGRALDVKGKIYMNEKPLETPTRVRSFRALGLREIEAEVASELPDGYVRKYVDVTQNQQLPSAHFVYGTINWGRAQTVGAHMTASRSGYYEIAVAQTTLNNHNRLGGDRMAVIALDLPQGEYDVNNAFYNAIAIVSQHAGSLPVMASRRVFIKKEQNISIFAGTMASEEGFYKIQLVEWEGDLSEDI